MKAAELVAIAKADDLCLGCVSLCCANPARAGPSWDVLLQALSGSQPRVYKMIYYLSLAALLSFLPAAWTDPRNLECLLAPRLGQS